MTRLFFKCKLLSEVILNQQSATDGANKTLDFIPGNSFLGIVAGQLYPKGDSNDMLELFHSGNVRFSDAHLTSDGRRAIKAPAALFYPKLEGPNGTCYVNYAIPDLEAEEIRKLQLKQLRSGFYVFDGEKAQRQEVRTHSAIKSAYDKNKRRSKDEQLYVYESLEKGLEFLFDVEITDSSTMNTPEWKEKIVGCLVGKRRLGRSKTAQYGLVEIEQVNGYEEVSSKEKGFSLSIDGTKTSCVTVYADGRLIFLDKFGIPTFQPTAQQLGFTCEAEILWDKSQIRTFQYSPWNYKRQCSDTDRCGIEKGSVFVVRCESAPGQSQYVGAYKNEGFGKVIYNPDFLKADDEGVALISFNANIETVYHSGTTMEQFESLKNSESTLLKYLGKQKEEEWLEGEICKEVNRWVKEEAKYFKGEDFASQWGTIRRLATLYTEEDDILFYLMGERTGKHNYLDNETAINTGYLVHGIASQKWKERNRIGKLRDYCTKFQGSLQKALINLSAEMAKTNKGRRK